VRRQHRPSQNTFHFAGTFGDMTGSGAGGLFEAAAPGPVRLRNRVIKAATFEGMS
jgi:hypothetical protein